MSLFLGVGRCNESFSDGAILCISTLVLSGFYSQESCIAWWPNSNLHLCWWNLHLIVINYFSGWCKHNSTSAVRPDHFHKCPTTSKMDAGPLMQLVSLCRKLEWDREGVEQGMRKVECGIDGMGQEDPEWADSAAHTKFKSPDSVWFACTNQLRHAPGIKMAQICAGPW